MDLADLAKIRKQATKSAFRLETLPQYLVPQEAERFAAWRAGEQLPLRTPENNKWLAELKRMTDSGIRWYRVHILDQPLSDYSRYEINSYLTSQLAGQQTYLVDRDVQPDLADLHEDFWLYDDEIAVRMLYDEEGRFLRPEMANNLQAYREIRDTVMKYAEPLDDYVARVKPKLTA